MVEADEERGADRYYRAKCSCRWWYSEPLASREIAVSVGNKHVRVDA